MQEADRKPPGRRGAARREQLAVKALEILGEKGLHAVTHRAVDAALGLPIGSCSFYYGTRLALIGAAADRLSEFDRRDLMRARDATGRIDVLQLMRHWTSATARTLLLARIELQLTALREPQIHALMLANRAFFVETTAAVLAAKGIDEAGRAASELLSLVDGELLRAALFTSPGESYAPSDAFSRELRRYR